MFYQFLRTLGGIITELIRASLVYFHTSSIFISQRDWTEEYKILNTQILMLKISLNIVKLTDGRSTLRRIEGRMFSDHSLSHTEQTGHHCSPRYQEIGIDDNLTLLVVYQKHAIL